MAWMVRCLYRPGGAQDRLAIREAHIRYMLTWLPRTVFGGALLDAQGQQPVGMVVMLAVDAHDQARAFIDAEPYFSAGLFDTVELLPLIQMTPPHTPDFLLAQLEKAQRTP